MKGHIYNLFLNVFGDNLGYSRKKNVVNCYWVKPLPRFYKKGFFGGGVFGVY